MLYASNRIVCLVGSADLYLLKCTKISRNLAWFAISASILVVLSIGL